MLAHGPAGLLFVARPDGPADGLVLLVQSYAASRL
jgi:hypothetical protein